MKNWIIFIIIGGNTVPFSLPFPPTDHSICLTQWYSNRQQLLCPRHSLYTVNDLSHCWTQVTWWFLDCWIHTQPFNKWNISQYLVSGDLFPFWWASVVVAWYHVEDLFIFNEQVMAEWFASMILPVMVQAVYLCQSMIHCRAEVFRSTSPCFEIMPNMKQLHSLLALSIH